jgi:hypothetical protein
MEGVIEYGKRYKISSSSSSYSYSDQSYRTPKITLQYNFKPSSINSEIPGSLKISNNNNDVNINLKNNELINKEFKGTLSNNNISEYLLTLNKNHEFQLFKSSHIISNLRLQTEENLEINNFPVNNYGKSQLPPKLRKNNNNKRETKKTITKAVIKKNEVNNNNNNNNNNNDSNKDIDVISNSQEEIDHKKDINDVDGDNNNDSISNSFIFLFENNNDTNENRCIGSKHKLSPYHN